MQDTAGVGDAVNVTAIRMNPMHERPKAGQRIALMLKTGKIIGDAHATRVITPDGKDGIVIYHQRKAIDESRAAGWWVTQ